MNNIDTNSNNTEIHALGYKYCEGMSFGRQCTNTLALPTNNIFCTPCQDKFDRQKEYEQQLAGLRQIVAVMNDEELEAHIKDLDKRSSQLIRELNVARGEKQARKEKIKSVENEQNAKAKQMKKLDSELKKEKKTNKLGVDPVKQLRAAYFRIHKRLLTDEEVQKMLNMND